MNYIYIAGKWLPSFVFQNFHLFPSNTNTSLYPYPAQVENSTSCLCEVSRFLRLEKSYDVSLSVPILLKHGSLKVQCFIPLKAESNAYAALNDTLSASDRYLSCFHIEWLWIMLLRPTLNTCPDSRFNYFSFICRWNCWSYLISRGIAVL